MEELQPKPTPLPRSSPVGHNQNLVNGQQIKKPVPLPRSSAIPSSSSKTSGAEDKASSENNSFEEVFTKGYNTLTKSIKNKFKSASGNVQGKSKTVLETTKTVGLKTERSVRGILHKRQSATPLAISKNDEPGQARIKVDRCQSLPSEDIFSSIKFGSPIQNNHLDNTYESDSDQPSFPPPEYPPPPLPDESLYDELSTKSSHSGSHGDYYTCPSLISSSADPGNDSDGTYEEVLALKHLSIVGGSDSNSSTGYDPSIDTLTRHQSVSESDCGSSHSCEIQCSPEFKSARVSRSESWSFYDTVHIPSKNPINEQYVNVSIQNNESNKNNSNLSKSSTESEHKITALKPLQPIKVSDDCNDSSSKKTSLARQESVISNTGSEGSSISVPNELYLNWQPLILKTNQGDKATVEGRSKFATKSFFSEFDPLYENLTLNGKTNKKCVETESLPVLNEEVNGLISDEFDTASLPVPPRRYDSITAELSEQLDIPNDVEYFLYHRPSLNYPVSDELLISESVDSQESPENTISTGTGTSAAENTAGNSPDTELCPGKRKSNLARWSSMKRAIKKVADASHWSPGSTRKTGKAKDEDISPKEDNNIEIVEKPYINSSTGPIHSGFLFRSPSAGEKQKDFVQKWCQLAEGRLTFSAEKNSSNRDIVLVEHIYSIQIVRETKQSSDGEDVYCMEVSCSLRDKPHFIGSPGTTERRIWMQKLLESLTLVFPSRLTAEYTRAGWCFFKEGISGNWLAAWLLLHKRTLFFNPSKGKLSEIDLRKARTIVLQDNEEGCVRVAEKGPLIRIDCLSNTACAYYLQMNEPRETKAWCRMVREAAVDNGPMLHDQQLTKDDLPTIIDKCINFVYAHGSMSEGVYRRSGSNTNVLRLLTAFQKDAWAVQITRGDYTEHDVASVLKRFFRDLPEPLLTTSLHKVLCNAAVLECSEEEKVSMYRSLLEKLPPVNYVTTRRLMGHLYHIHRQCERNLMPVENLAAIWGPTLMHVESQQAGMDPNWSRNESQVVHDLISLYPRLFHVGGAELAREQRIEEVLERYHNSSQQTPHVSKPSGDIKVWIYISSKDSDCVSVTVGPHRDALDVCNELCPKMNVYGHELCLLESVLGGALIRPLHHTEKVLDTVLRWGYWDDTDCRDNCLILVINTIIRDIAPLAKPPIAQCGELRFADRKSKSFKAYLFEFSQAKLCYYKDKMGSVKLGEWKIEDIVWYIGHEPKRNPHTRWSITFINKNNRSKRSKEKPFFGCTIAGTTRDEQLRWMAAMLVGEFPHVDLLPRPQLNLLE